MKRRKDGSIITTEVVQDAAYFAAHQAKATHRDGIDQTKFYKKDSRGIRVGYYYKNQFQWAGYYWSSYMPETAGVI